MSKVPRGLFITKYKNYKFFIVDNRNYMGLGANWLIRRKIKINGKDRTFLEDIASTKSEAKKKLAKLNRYRAKRDV